MPIKIMNFVTIFVFIRHTMERKTKKKKLSGWDRKKMQETAKHEQESSKCRKLDGYLSFSTLMTSAAPEVEPSEDSLSTFSPEEGDISKLLWLNLRWDPQKTPAAAAAQVVEVEPSEDLAKPGPLNYLVEVDPLEDLPTSTDYRPEVENDTVRLCAIIDTCKEYPTYPHLFCDTHVTHDLVRALLVRQVLKRILTGFQ